MEKYDKPNLVILPVAQRKLQLERLFEPSSHVPKSLHTEERPSPDKLAQLATEIAINVVEAYPDIDVADFEAFPLFEAEKSKHRFGDVFTTCDLSSIAVEYKDRKKEGVLFLENIKKRNVRRKGLGVQRKKM